MRTLYTLWILILFVGSFFILFPLYYVFLQKKKWHHLAHELTKIWARIIIYLSFIRVEIVFEEKLDKSETVIFTPNHFSYFDIPIIAFSAPGNYKFIGKKSLGEIPIFGYMFRKLYLTVNRTSKIDAYRALLKGLECLDSGIGLVVFPEGGIVSGGPELASFKEGAFRMAIERQIPIVPVSIPFNWIFLYDQKKLRVKYRKLKVVYHKKIITKGLDIDSVDELKNKTFEIIEKQLKTDNNSENR